MTEFNPKAILVTRFTETELDDALSFDSGCSETNSFFHNDAFAEQERGLSTTTLFFYNGILAGFLSMCCDVIPLDKEGDGKANYSVPAIKIRFATGKAFKDYEGFDSFIIDYAKNIAWEIGSSKVGVRFLTLDAPLSMEEYFTGKGFVRNNSTADSDLISMRMDIFE